MRKLIDIKIFPDRILDSDFILDKLAKVARIDKKKINDWHIVRKSIDARFDRPVFILKIELTTDEKLTPTISICDEFGDVSHAKEVLIIGAGPAGYFAALQLIEQGYRPIVLERGIDVQARRRDLKAIQQDGIVNPHSNYCFGEGGAGTYSDGKLYTRSKKRGKIEKVLQLLVEHGAKEDILIDAHPHIGSNKLPKLIAAIRSTIEEHGGKILFNHFVTELIIENKSLKGVKITDGSSYRAEATILATGHSARDIYYMLDQYGIKIEAKAFALGLRIEHPQKLIDKIQYNQDPREDNLPASSYKLASQVEGKGTFSFCMCPGGLIVPSATAPGEIVVNGMSLSKRDSTFANSGIVTSIDLEELDSHGYKGVFAALEFQKDVEQKMFNAGDGSQKAPAQIMTDFVKGKHSKTLNISSYIPGVYSANLNELLPKFVYHRLSRGLINFGNKMKNYMTDSAQLVGVESRTSSPLRIPRNRESYMSDELSGFFPCGEGAGYAGGILSAAMDGQNVAKGVIAFFESNVNGSGTKM